MHQQNYPQSVNEPALPTSTLKFSGDGLATAGIIMGWIQVALTVVGICCVSAYFVFMVGMVKIEPR